MHILMISDVYFPRVNGVSTSIQSFCKNLRSLGHAVTLIAPDYGVPLNDEQGIIRIPSRVVIVDKEDRMLKRGALRKVVKRLDLSQFDLVHIQTPFVAHYEGVRIAKKGNLRVISSYHTFFEEYFYHYIKWLPREFTRYVARSFSRQQCKQYDGIIVPSIPMQEVLNEYGIHTPTRRIPTGMNVDVQPVFQAEDFRKQYDIPENLWMLLFVGRVAFEKNIEFLLEVGKELRDKNLEFTLVIAGKGPAEQALIKQAKALELTEYTRFLGYLDRETELQSCYQAADLFMFASRTETQGLVLLEAMANGTPVVSTAVMGTKEVMGDNRGGLIAEESPALFANAVQRLLADDVLYQDRKQDALAYVQEWGEEAMTARLIDFYTDVCDKSFVA